MADHLPPLPDEDADALYIHAGGERQGPLSRRALAARLASGDVSDGDHFWYEGIDGWARIGDHTSLVDGLATETAPWEEPEDDDGVSSVAPASSSVPEPVAAGSAEDHRLDGVFGDLVEGSWKYYRQHEFAGHIDEVFLGAVITSALDDGYVLIDLNSDGTHHYLRFEDLEGGGRVICRVTHLTTGLTASKVQGHRAGMVVGYGERVSNFNKVWQALKAEYKSGFIDQAEPGTITVDGDMNSGYVYVQVDLFWKIDDYVEEDYDIHYDLLADHLHACVHALRKYLRGRFA